MIVEDPIKPVPELVGEFEQKAVEDRLPADTRSFSTPERDAINKRAIFEKRTSSLVEHFETRIKEVGESSSVESLDEQAMQVSDEEIVNVKPTEVATSPSAGEFIESSETTTPVVDSINQTEELVQKTDVSYVESMDDTQKQFSDDETNLDEIIEKNERKQDEKSINELDEITSDIALKSKTVLDMACAEPLSEEIISPPKELPEPTFPLQEPVVDDSCVTYTEETSEGKIICTEVSHDEFSSENLLEKDKDLLGSLGDVEISDKTEEVHVTTSTHISDDEIKIIKEYIVETEEIQDIADNQTADFTEKMTTTPKEEITIDEREEKIIESEDIVIDKSEENIEAPEQEVRVQNVEERRFSLDCEMMDQKTDEIETNIVQLECSFRSISPDSEFKSETNITSQFKDDVHIDILNDVEDVEPENIPKENHLQRAESPDSELVESNTIETPYGRGFLSEENVSEEVAESVSELEKSESLDSSSKQDSTVVLGSKEISEIAEVEEKTSFTDKNVETIQDSKEENIKEEALISVQESLPESNEFETKQEFFVETQAEQKSLGFEKTETISEIQDTIGYESTDRYLKEEASSISETNELETQKEISSVVQSEEAKPEFDTESFVPSDTYQKDISTMVESYEESSTVEKPETFLQTTTSLVETVADKPDEAVESEINIKESSEINIVSHQIQSSSEFKTTDIEMNVGTADQKNLEDDIVQSSSFYKEDVSEEYETSTSQFAEEIHTEVESNVSENLIPDQSESMDSFIKESMSETITSHETEMEAIAKSETLSTFESNREYKEAITSEVSESSSKMDSQERTLEVQSIKETQSVEQVQEFESAVRKESEIILAESEETIRTEKTESLEIIETGVDPEKDNLDKSITDIEIEHSPETNFTEKENIKEMNNEEKIDDAKDFSTEEEKLTKRQVICAESEFKEENLEEISNEQEVQEANQFKGSMTLDASDEVIKTVCEEVQPIEKPVVEETQNVPEPEPEPQEQVENFVEVAEKHEVDSKEEVFSDESKDQILTEADLYEQPIATSSSKPVNEVCEVLADGTRIQKKVFKTSAKKIVTRKVRRVDEKGDVIEDVVTEEVPEHEILSETSSLRSSVSSLASSIGSSVKDLESPVVGASGFQSPPPEPGSVHLYTDTLEGEPQTFTETEEFEEVLPSGQTIVRKVTKTKQQQVIVRRVLLQGDEAPESEEEARQILQQTIQSEPVVVHSETQQTDDGRMETTVTQQLVSEQTYLEGNKFDSEFLKTEDQLLEPHEQDSGSKIVIPIPSTGQTLKEVEFSVDDNDSQNLPENLQSSLESKEQFSQEMISSSSSEKFYSSLCSSTMTSSLEQSTSSGDRMSHSTDTPDTIIESAQSPEIPSKRDDSIGNIYELSEKEVEEIKAISDTIQQESDNEQRAEISRTSESRSSDDAFPDLPAESDTVAVEKASDENEKNKSNIHTDTVVPQGIPDPMSPEPIAHGLIGLEEQVHGDIENEMAELIVNKVMAEHKPLTISDSLEAQVGSKIPSEIGSLSSEAETRPLSPSMYSLEDDGEDNLPSPTSHTLIPSLETSVSSQHQESLFSMEQSKTGTEN